MSDEKAPIQELEDQELDLKSNSYLKEESILKKLDDGDENFDCLASIMHPDGASFLYLIEEKRKKEAKDTSIYTIAELYEEDEKFQVTQLEFPEETDYETVLGYLFNYIFRVIDEDEDKEKKDVS